MSTSYLIRPYYQTRATIFLLCFTLHKCQMKLLRMVENDEKHSKMSKKYLFYHAHKRLTKKNKEKSLLVSNWEWLPIAGCSFGILLLFELFSTCTSRAHDDVLWKTLLRMTQNVYFFTHFRVFSIAFDYAAFAGRNTQHETHGRQNVKQNLIREGQSRFFLCSLICLHCCNFNQRCKK